MKSLSARMRAIGIHALVFIAVLFLPRIAFGQIREWTDPDGDPLTNDTCLVNGVPTFKCLEVVIANLLFMSNGLIIMVIFIMFVIGSFKYLTSLGDSSKIEEAKGTFKWAIIGLVVYVSAYLILRIIDILFLGGNGDIFKFQIGG